MKDLRRLITGKKGEDLAIDYLKKSGYEILERNYRCYLGEIDVIAKEGDTLAFIEVKARATAEYGHPETSVGYAKQRKISRVSLDYIQRHDLFKHKARFDVVAIKITPAGIEICLIKNAFDLVT